MKKYTHLFIRILCFALCLTMIAPHAAALTPTYIPSESYQNSSFYTALTSVVLTKDQRTDIVNVAKSQIGYTEGNKANQLSGFSKGSSNFTEYGAWYDMQSMWCSMFVSWCAAQAGIPTSIIPKGALSNDVCKQFKSWGLAYTPTQVTNGQYTPRIGDIIYMKRGTHNAQNEVNHVGIVTSYANNSIYIIEGNTNDCVAYNNYNINDTRIKYICSPNYSSSQTHTPPCLC